MIFKKIERELFYLLIFQSEFHEERFTSEEIENLSTGLVENSEQFLEVGIKKIDLGTVEKVVENFESVKEEIDTIDKKLESKLKGWKIGRIGKVELSILRAFVYEFERVDDEEDISKIINHLVDLAHKYGDDKSYKFVNGVMGNIARERNRDDS